MAARPIELLRAAALVAQNSQAIAYQIRTVRNLRPALARRAVSSTRGQWPRVRRHWPEHNSQRVNSTASSVFRGVLSYGRGRNNAPAGTRERISRAVMVIERRCGAAGRAPPDWLPGLPPR